MPFARQHTGSTRPVSGVKRFVDHELLFPAIPEVIRVHVCVHRLVFQQFWSTISREHDVDAASGRFAAWLPVKAQHPSDGTRLFSTAEAIKPNVVQVIPHFTHPNDDPPPVGFGIIIGVQNGRLYIATPGHIAWSKRDPATFDDKPSVIFFEGDRSPVQAVREKFLSSTDDIAVLSAPQPANVHPVISRPIYGSAIADRTPVTNIGRETDWILPEPSGIFAGIATAQNKHWLRAQGLATPTGASGGAVVTSQGLIGVVRLALC
jgi:hypothetical protein